MLIGNCYSTLSLNAVAAGSNDSSVGDSGIKWVWLITMCCSIHVDGEGVYYILYLWLQAVIGVHVHVHVADNDQHKNQPELMKVCKKPSNPTD